MNKPSDEGEESALRSAQDVFDEFYACELVWAKVRVPTENDFEEVLNSSVDLEKETLILKNRRPNCRDFLGKNEKYEDEFSEYHSEVRNKLQVNDHALHQLDALLFTKEKIEYLRETIDTLTKMRRKKWDLLTIQSIEYTTKVLLTLVSLKHNVDNVNPKLLIELERVKKGLDKNHSTLIELLEPTHEWLILNSEKKKRCTICSKEISLEEIKKQHTIYDEESKDYPHYW
jgi:hypothetical protein